MERADSVLLPHILETLSEKEKFCDTYENLCNELKFVFSDKNLQNREIEKRIDSALSVGQNLGILTWINERIRLPFNYKKKTTTKGVKRAALHLEKDQMLLTQPRRIHSDMPTIMDLRQVRRNTNAGRIQRRNRSRSRISRSRSQPKHR